MKNTIEKDTWTNVTDEKVWQKVLSVKAVSKQETFLIISEYNDMTRLGVVRASNEKILANKTREALLDIGKTTQIRQLHFSFTKKSGLNGQTFTEAVFGEKAKFEHILEKKIRGEVKGVTKDNNWFVLLYFHTVFPTTKDVFIRYSHVDEDDQNDWTNSPGSIGLSYRK